MKISQGQVDHDQISGVSADDHHAQAHKAAHSDAGADEIKVEDLGATSSDVSTALRPDGTGGVAFADVTHANLASVGWSDHHNHSSTGIVAHANTSGKTATDHHDHSSTGIVAHANTSGRTATDHHDHASTGIVPHANTSGKGVDDHHAESHAARHKDGGADELDVEELATAGGAGTVPTSNGAGAVTMQAIPTQLQIVTGTYTGDGSDPQTISGLGITPEFVMSCRANGSDIYWSQTQAQAANLAFLMASTNVFDSIGNFVSGAFDAALDSNASTQTYYYVAIGS